MRQINDKRIKTAYKKEVYYARWRWNRSCRNGADDRKGGRFLCRIFCPWLYESNTRIRGVGLSRIL
jgi:hypothetical protein